MSVLPAIDRVEVLRNRMAEVGTRNDRMRNADLVNRPSHAVASLFMAPPDLKDRTKSFALRVIKLTESLPATRAADVIGKQLLRSATSVGANYRASRRARSRADFVNKLGIVEEEADEASYWLELLVESGLVPHVKLAELMRECDEITAIIVASIRTAKERRD